MKHVRRDSAPNYGLDAEANDDVTIIREDEDDTVLAVRDRPDRSTSIVEIGDDGRVFAEVKVFKEWALADLGEELQRIAEDGGGE